MAGFATALDYTILLLAKKLWNLFAFLLSAGEAIERAMSLRGTETAWNSCVFVRYFQENWMVHLRELKTEDFELNKQKILNT